MHLVPIASASADARRKTKAVIARHYNVRGPFRFLHVNLLDNRSEFSAPLEVNLRKEGDDYWGRCSGRSPSRTPSLDSRGGRASPHLLDVRLNFDSVDYGRRSRAARTRNGTVQATYCRKKTVLKSMNVAKTSRTAR